MGRQPFDANTASKNRFHVDRWAVVAIPDARMQFELTFAHSNLRPDIRFYGGGRSWAEAYRVYGSAQRVLAALRAISAQRSGVMLLAPKASLLKPRSATTHF